MTYTIYKENPKDSTQKLLELVNEFGKLEGYKINIQKSVAFLYTITMKYQKENEKKKPFKITHKKYLGNLTKELTMLRTIIINKGN